MTARPDPTVSVITVAYGAEPWLEPGVEACLASAGETVEVVLVDNGCTDGAVDRLEQREGVTVVRPGSNGGFAGGCVEGAAVARGGILAFINPDAIVEADCLHELAEELRGGTTGIATGSLRLASDPESLNSAGNDIHFLGLSWSGAFGEPASDHTVRREVLGGSGACMAITAAHYHELGGFEPEFFAYHEDADLSLRSWQSGMPVVYVPSAVARHRYEFGRHGTKYYLIDRNRMIFLLTLWGAPTLLWLAPLLVVQEIAMWALAAAEGWLPQRRQAVGWLIGHRRWLAQRRQRMQSARIVPDRAFAEMFAVALNPGNLETPGALRLINPLLGLYWRVVRVAI